MTSSGQPKAGKAGQLGLNDTRPYFPTQVCKSLQGEKQQFHLTENLQDDIGII
jgi:hypothetical protein